MAGDLRVALVSGTSTTAVNGVVAAVLRTTWPARHEPVVIAPSIQGSETRRGAREIVDPADPPRRHTGSGRVGVADLHDQFRADAHSGRIVLSTWSWPHSSLRTARTQPASRRAVDNGTVEGRSGFAKGAAGLVAARRADVWHTGALSIMLVVADKGYTAEELQMTTLDPADGYVVLINTFTVDPDKAEDLLAELSLATETGMRRRPGFVSANLHISSDRRHVANYAQWRTQEDLDAMMADLAAQDHMRKAADIATSFDPIYYELRESTAADGG